MAPSGFGPSDAPAHPLVWLGAPSPGGLILPAANPTPSQMYAPRGVYFDDNYFIVADTGNHRVLIWFGIPTGDGAPADVVLGQPDFFTEKPNGLDPARGGLHLPTGLTVLDHRLYVADAWNHRILVWERVPQTSATPPDYVLGQENLHGIIENRGGTVTATGMYWPFGIGSVAGHVYVTDTGNRRVLVWEGEPEPDQPPAFILGQDSPDNGQENRGVGVGPNTFRWPHAIAGTDQRLYIADAGNHRILGWTPPPRTDQPANFVLGQPDFAKAVEWPYGKQGPRALRFPYALALENETLACADTANNRILFWRGLPDETFRPADAVIGQKNFDENGENRWDAVGRDTLCWPYGLHLHRNRLAIADSGNNRVMIWEMSR